jgi:hypothetical protein
MGCKCKDKPRFEGQLPSLKDTVVCVLTEAGSVCVKVEPGETEEQARSRALRSSRSP